MSPHLQVWKWHPTMASSIFHRASGMVNAAWVAALALWIVYAAWTGEADFSALFTGGGLTALIAYLLVLGALVSTSYHFLNGLRHLVWDAGFGFEPGFASAVSWFNLIAGAGLGLGLFAWFAVSVGG